MNNKWRVDDFGGSDTIAISRESPEGGREVMGLGAKSESPTGAKERFIRELVADANRSAGEGRDGLARAAALLREAEQLCEWIGEDSRGERAGVMRSSLIGKAAQLLHAIKAAGLLDEPATADPVTAPVGDSCAWPGCDSPAFCTSGNFGGLLVCAGHFKIVNGAAELLLDEPTAAASKTPKELQADRDLFAQQYQQEPAPQPAEDEDFSRLLQILARLGHFALSRTHHQECELCRSVMQQPNLQQPTVVPPANAPALKVEHPSLSEPYYWPWPKERDAQAELLNNTIYPWLREQVGKSREMATFTVVNLPSEDDEAASARDAMEGRR